MKSFLSAVFLAGLLSAPVCIAAQPPASKPAQSTPPAPAQTPAPASTQATSTARYIVGPEDSIQVTVWKEPTLSGIFPVRPDGMISIALVGDIVASGRTPMELANDLTERLKKFIQDPTVAVTVLAVNSKRVFLLGEVNHTGPIALTSDLTPLQAISAAGGLTPYASRRKIYILRTEPGKPTPKKIPFDYTKAIKDGNQQGVVLLPGDTIVVP